MKRVNLNKSYFIKFVTHSKDKGVEIFRDKVKWTYTKIPDYRKHLTWFKQCNIINFETCYVMRRQAFRKYATELFEILEYIFKNCSNVYPTVQTTSEPLPWRYPGFLGERFFPFFMYANGLKRIQVPLVVLQ